MELGETKIEAGPIKFALHYEQDIMHDQGLRIQVGADIDGKEVEVFRFNCFDQAPCYHYGPENGNETVPIDKTFAGNTVVWALKQLRSRLPTLVRESGYPEIANQLDKYEVASLVASKLDDLEQIAKEKAIKERRFAANNRGDEIIEVGNIRFGLEFINVPTRGAVGVAMHIMSDIEGREVELGTFDCFEHEPHYHYGPRSQDVRIVMDQTMIPDTLEWTLDQIREGKLSAMLLRSGYPNVVAGLDTDLLRKKLDEEIAPKARAMRAAHGE